MNDIVLKKPEGDVGNPVLGGATVATNGEAVNPYEGLTKDARNNDREYQELSHYEILRTQSQLSHKVTG